MNSRRAAAGVVAVAAFALYRSTLLPGFDFGDTGSFQTIVGFPLITPRDAYPLYFAIGRAFVGGMHADPAWALNLASAVEGAMACGLIVMAAAELAGSTAAGVAGGLLFAVSYTFWSQATIAEVYGLHACFVALTLLLLLGWSARPTTARLAVFFLIFALAFGNHLSTVLLLPGYTVFILLAAPRGWRSMFAWRIVGLAAVCAALGAALYVLNLRTLWLQPYPPRSLVDGLQTFWFDVTKSDWRETMVLHVPGSMLHERLAMYWFDVRQQFGPIVPALAVIGVVRLWIAERRRAMLVFLLYSMNVAFAFGYNVGDSHVFYLPSHLLLAVLVASSLPLAGLVTRRGAVICAAVLILYAGFRAHRDFPALDRSADRRPERVMAALTSGIDDRNAVLLTDLNWQVANGLFYYANAVRPEVAWSRASDVLLYAPALTADNQAIERDIVLTERARDDWTEAFGPLLPVDRDARVPTPPLADAVRALPRGTRYALCVLRPPGGYAIDGGELDAALQSVTGGSTELPRAEYVAIAGVTGQRPELVVGSEAPFTRSLTIAGVPVELRMESWLAFDTIRRMGFGHVVASRQHTLIVERGVSFVAFDSNGQPLQTEYRANIFAPQARYLVARPRAGTP
jgi:Protein O-mannosyl-transferase TMEM260-like